MNKKLSFIVIILTLLVLTLIVFFVQTFTNNKGQQNINITLPTPKTRVTISEILNNKDKYVGRELLIEGKVLFDFSCPPSGPEPENSFCISTGYLVDKDTVDILQYKDTNAIVLYENGEAISCVAQTLANLNCKGWIHNRGYQTDVILDYQDLNGTKTSTLILKVKSKQIL